MVRALKLDGADRTRTVALMAATLEAGDRAAHTGAAFDGTASPAHHYVARALDMLDDAEEWLKAKG